MATDSDFDCFIGETNGAVKYYENTGNSSSASFTERTSSDNPLNIDVGNQSAPTLIDIDNDNDNDCFIGDVDGNISYYENTGSVSSASFTERTSSDNPLNIDVGTNATPTFIDIDNDGDFDCFIGNADGYIKYYENTGSVSSASFTERTSSDNPLNIDVGTNATPTFIDIDNDGDFDCFIGNANGYIKYYENTGSVSSASFTERTSSDNPLNIDVGTNAAPTFIDIDNDGDFDCFIGEGNGTIKYYENTGNISSASFTERTSSDNPLNIDIGNMSNLTFADIDNSSDWVTSYAVIGDLGSSYKTDVEAIWSVSGTSESDASNGLTMTVSSALTTGNFAVFGNNNTSDATTADLGSVASTIRTARIWQVDESGTVAATMKIDISDATGLQVERVLLLTLGSCTVQVLQVLLVQPPLDLVSLEML